MPIREFNGPGRAWQVTAIERELLLLWARSRSWPRSKAAVPAIRQRHHTASLAFCKRVPQTLASSHRQLWSIIDWQCCPSAGKVDFTLSRWSIRFLWSINGNAS